MILNGKSDYLRMGLIVFENDISKYSRSQLVYDVSKLYSQYETVHNFISKSKSTGYKEAFRILHNERMCRKICCIVTNNGTLKEVFPKTSDKVDFNPSMSQVEQCS